MYILELRNRKCIIIEFGYGIQIVDRSIGDAHARMLMIDPLTLRLDQ